MDPFYGQKFFFIMEQHKSSSKFSASSILISSLWRVVDSSNTFSARSAFSSSPTAAGAIFGFCEAAEMTFCLWRLDFKWLSKALDDWNTLRYAWQWCEASAVNGSSFGTNWRLVLSNATLETGGRLERVSSDYSAAIHLDSARAKDIT